MQTAVGRVVPLYVFCGPAMLACYLRPSQIDGARHAGAILKLRVKRLGRCWPDTRIIVRADSGFCRQNPIRWCERAGVGYVSRLARNSRLEAAVSVVEMAMPEAYERTGLKQRELGEFRYAAASWDRERRVISRLEYGAQGVNPRFVVTNLEADPAALYDGLYCARGGAENRIKDAQVDLFGTRASCHRFEANQPAAVGRARLHADAQVAPNRAHRYRTRASRGQHDPRSPAQDRRSDPAQYAPHPADARLAPSDARGVRRRRPPTGRLEPVEPTECRPRHVEKQRGYGVVSLRTAKPLPPQRSRDHPVLRTQSAALKTGGRIYW